MMQARSKLKPGQKGIRKLAVHYGSCLVCVHYQYDKARQLRHKTMELIVESIPWNPQVEHIPPDSMVGLKVELKEVSLQKQIIQADENGAANFGFEKFDTTRWLR